jgi:predicted ferric reductase
LFIADRSGIEPLCTALDSLPAAPADGTLLYRAVTDSDARMLDENCALGARRGIVLHTLSGPDTGESSTDQLGIPSIMRLVPDVLARDVFVCGSPDLVDPVRRRLRLIGLPVRRVHSARF